MKPPIFRRLRALLRRTDQRIADLMAKNNSLAEMVRKQERELAQYRWVEIRPDYINDELRLLIGVRRGALHMFPGMIDELLDQMRRALKDAAR